MVIKRIILHKYKRFSLKEVETFDYEPNSNLVIFKWGNGVGKSSLLQQLNPLPAELKRDFLDGGFKEIHIEHLGRNYVLISKEGKHSFIEDGVELNQGGTKKAQLELVEEKFKLNSNVLSVVNGYSRFTLMSPSERKYWLTRISSTDYTYVIGIYNKLLERKRDNSGTIKNSKDVLAKFEKELLDIGNIDSVIQEQDKIKDVIEDLLKSYIHTKTVDDITPILDNLEYLVKEIKKNPIYDKRQNLENVTLEKLSVAKETNITKLNMLKSEEEKLSKELETISQPYDKEVLPKLKKELEDITKYVSKYNSLIEEFNMDPYQIINFEYNTLLPIRDRLDNIKSIVSDSDIEFKDVISDEDLSEKLEEIKTQITNLKLLSSKTEESVSKLDGLVVKSFTCGGCGTKIPISSITESMKNRNENIEKTITSIQESYGKLKTIQDLRVSYKQLLTEFKKIKYYDFVNRLVSSDITDNDFNTLDKIVIITDTYKSALDYCKESILPKLASSKNLSEAIIKEEIRIKTIESIGVDRKESIKKRLDEITEEKRKLVVKANAIEEFTSNLSSFNKIIESIYKQLGNYNKVRRESSKLMNNKLIELLVADLKVKSKELNTLIDKRKDIEAKVKLLTNTIIEKEDNNSDINILLDILSPSNGLIAKSVNSFIGKIINDMNLIINSVWSYKMRLLKCEISDTSDLDYKFKVEVNDSFIVEDISKLSSSMQEIVDLAFRLVFIKYMEFNEIPIILDEFGRTMDQEHRIQSFNMIDSVICNNYEQVFLVSHFEEMYGRFKNASFPEIK